MRGKLYIISSIIELIIDVFANLDFIVHSLSGGNMTRWRYSFNTGNHIGSRRHKRH